MILRSVQIYFEESIVYSESPLTGVISLLWLRFCRLDYRNTLERVSFLLLFCPELRNKLDSMTAEDLVLSYSRGTAKF
jgi:hypothetical protein